VELKGVRRFVDLEVAEEEEMLVGVAVVEEGLAGPAEGEVEGELDGGEVAKDRLEVVRRARAVDLEEEAVEGEDRVEAGEEYVAHLDWRELIRVCVGRGRV